MNFINTFDELNKLYEEVEPKESFCAQFNVKVNDAFYGEMLEKLFTRIVRAMEAGYTQEEAIELCCNEQDKRILRHVPTNDGNTIDFTKAPVLEGCNQGVCDKELSEAAEDEVVEDEIPVEEVPVEEPATEDEEPRRLILECDKCGALVIKDEKDVVVDEETDLANIEDECEFCEEANGYKIVGVVTPYDVIDEEAPAEDAIVDEPEVVEDGAPIDKALVEEVTETLAEED